LGFGRTCPAIRYSSTTILNFSAKGSRASSRRRASFEAAIRSTAACGVSASAARFEEPLPALFEPMPLEDSPEAPFVQRLAAAFEQVLDLESIGRAMGLQRHGDGMLLGEDTRRLVADAHLPRLGDRLLDQGRRRGEDLDGEALDQDRVA